MEKSFVLSGNKLIAEFMNYEYIPYESGSKISPGWWKRDTPEKLRIMGYGNKLKQSYFLARNHHSLRYYNSWDWLMSAISKCIKFDIYSSEWTNQLHDGLLAQDREMCFEAVVEFIKWFNKKEK